MLPYEFHPLAAVELDEAVAYYEAILAGKGLELARQVQAALEQVRQFPESVPITRGTVRSIIVQTSTRWGFTLHYRVKPAGIRVLAVAHQSVSRFTGSGVDSLDAASLVAEVDTV